MKGSKRKIQGLHKNSATTRSRKNWADLQTELLGLILEKLVLLPDYIRFGAVCKGWQSAARYNYQDRRRTCHQQPPMILLPPELPAHCRRLYNILHSPALFENRHRLYSICEQKIYPHPLTIPYTRTFSKTETFCGSSYGWFVVSHKDCYIKLLNPFSGNIIQLPFIRDADEEKCTVTLSYDPGLNPDNWVAVAIYHTESIAIYDMESRLAIIRAGHDLWYNIRYPEGGVIAAGFYKGHLYVMNHTCELWRIVVQDEADFGSVKMLKQLTKIKVERSKFYFVELEGDLLLVCRSYDSRVSGFLARRGRTLGFCVYKLCLKEEQSREDDSDVELAEWIEMNDLGKFCLFLGMNKPICISTTTFPSCRPNCIYYTADTHKNYLGNLRHFGDMGVFDLATGDISSFESISAFQPRISSAIWISPNLC